METTPLGILDHMGDHLPARKVCKISNAECSVPGGRITAGLCVSHYSRKRKYGDPNWEVRPKYEMHGMTNAPEHKVWLSMIHRCTNRHAPNYVDYGGRGVRICARWRGSFIAFYQDMGSRPEDVDSQGRALFSIDRADVDGNYSCGKCDECRANGWPANCRWADRVTQAYNQRKHLSYGGSKVRSAYRGVSTSDSRWEARVKHNGVSIYLGRFSTEEGAARARDAKVIELGIETPLNFPWLGSVPPRD